MLGAADVSEVHAASMFMGKVSVDCSYWPATGPKSSFPLSPIFMGLRDHLPAVPSSPPPFSLRLCRRSLHVPLKHGNMTYFHMVLISNNRTNVKEETSILNLFVCLSGFF